MVNARDETPKPRPIEGVDVRRLPIGPEEAYVHSRVDGLSSTDEIALASGLDLDRVKRCLRRLSELGAIVIEDGGQPSPMNEVSGEHTVKLTVDGEGRAEPMATGTEPFGPTELEAAADVAPERQQQILLLHSQLDVLNYYQLLGVDPTADRRRIKTAYYERAAIFHPDRYFGKNLGSLRAKLEKCFACLTTAQDVLSSAQARAEYDAYLATQRRAHDIERTLTQAVTLQDIEQLERELMRQAEAAEDRPSELPSQTSSAPPRLSLSPGDRRRALARKLGHGLPGASVPPSPSVPPRNPVPREHAAENLRRHYEQHLIRLRAERRDAQLAAADQALLRSDPVTAANSLKIAQSLAPQDPEVAARLRAATDLATAALSDTYLKQGEYEEKNGRFQEAARSFERAASGQSSPKLWERAARCLLLSNGDLRIASDLAKRALALEPDRAEGHFLLGQIYLAAKMPKSAITELERARQLAPADDNIRVLLQRLQRGAE